MHAVAAHLLVSLGALRDNCALTLRLSLSLSLSLSVTAAQQDSWQAQNAQADQQFACLSFAPCEDTDLEALGAMLDCTNAHDSTECAGWGSEIDSAVSARARPA